MLLAHGGDPTIPGNTGDTPLIAAASKGNTEVVEALLLLGSCNSGITDGSGAAAMSVGGAGAAAAAVEGRERLSVSVSVLVTPTNRGGDTAVHVAAAKGFSKVLTLLLQSCECEGSKEVVNTANIKGLYPLHAAVSNGDAAR